MERPYLEGLKKHVRIHLLARSLRVMHMETRFDPMKPQLSSLSSCQGEEAIKPASQKALKVH